MLPVDSIAVKVSDLNSIGQQTLLHKFGSQSANGNSFPGAGQSAQHTSCRIRSKFSTHSSAIRSLAVVSEGCLLKDCLIHSARANRLLPYNPITTDRIEVHLVCCDSNCTVCQIDSVVAIGSDALDDSHRLTLSTATSEMSLRSTI